MPWHIAQDVADCTGFAVVKNDDGSVAGCHKTEGDAKLQLAALYANEPRMAAGDLPGHEFRGNQYTNALSGRAIDDNPYRPQVLSNRNEDVKAAFKDALKGPVPSVSEADGKALMLRVAAELDKANLGRESALGGGELTGLTNSQGSTGFSVRPMEEAGKYEMHVDLSGENANPALKWDEDGELPGGFQNPGLDKVANDVAKVVEGMGIPVSEARVSGIQGGGWDDDLGVTLTVDLGAKQAATRTAAGDLPGHEFRGNQYTQGGPKQAYGMVYEHGRAISYDPKTGPNEAERIRNYVEMHGKPPPAQASIAPPLTPPSTWFTPPEDMKPGQPLTITEDGRVYGYFFERGQCLLDGTRDCWQPPPSPSRYAAFHQGQVQTEEGTHLPVGVIGMTGGHANPTAAIPQAMAHYSDPSTVRMIVRAGDDEHGGWVAGSLVPGLSPEDVAQVRRSALSGDWRWFDQPLHPASQPGYDCLGPTLVNRPGLPITGRSAFTRVATAGGAVYLGGLMTKDQDCGCGKVHQAVGDLPGHEFRGNQHTRGDEGEGEKVSSLDKMDATALGADLQQPPPGISEKGHVAGAIAVAKAVDDRRDEDFTAAAKDMFTMMSDDPDLTVEMVYNTAQDQYRGEAEYALENNVNLSEKEANSLLTMADNLDEVASIYEEAAAGKQASLASHVDLLMRERADTHIAAAGVDAPVPLPPPGAVQAALAGLDARPAPRLAGESAGHEFRGNQYSDDAPSSADDPASRYDRKSREEEAEIRSERAVAAVDMVRSGDSVYANTFAEIRQTYPEVTRGQSDDVVDRALQIASEDPLGVIDDPANFYGLVADEVQDSGTDPPSREAAGAIADWVGEDIRAMYDQEEVDEALADETR